jgi:hypothetical protein
MTALSPTLSRIALTEQDRQRLFASGAMAMATATAPSPSKLAPLASRQLNTPGKKISSPYERRF